MCRVPSYSSDGRSSPLWFKPFSDSRSHLIVADFKADVYDFPSTQGSGSLLEIQALVDGYNQHNTNLITFHRIKNFRDLALDLTRDYER